MPVLVFTYQTLDHLVMTLYLGEGDPGLEQIRSLVSPDSDAVERVYLPATEHRRGDPTARFVELPARWRRDAREPPFLMVFVDGNRVAFTRLVPAHPIGTVHAYYEQSSSGWRLVVRCAASAPCGTAVAVDEASIRAITAASRALDHPGLMLWAAAAILACLIFARGTLREPSLRASSLAVGAAFTAGIVWYRLDLARDPNADLVLAFELAAIGLPTAASLPGALRRRPAIAIVGAVAAVVLAHVASLASLPVGLYLDEASIGHNAALIAATGADEHGRPWPVYFQAFGEYKNPIYVYAVAAMFGIAGVSELTLRLTSFLFFAVALLLYCLLLRGMFRGRRTLLFGLIAFGFLPQIFVVSRLAFEAIAQVTWIVAGTYGAWLSLESDRGARQKAGAIITGLLLGSGIYTYSTARLLSPLMLFTLLAVYPRRERLGTLTLMVTAFLVAMAPYVWFSWANPGALTARFEEVSYLDDPLPLTAKAVLFLRNYVAHWTPSFLLYTGDANERHAIGAGGIVFVSVWVAAVLGGVVVLRLAGRARSFGRFVLANALLAPVAAALTHEGIPHALRCLPLAVFLLLLAGYGYSWLASLAERRAAATLTAVLAGILVFEAVAYSFVYFVHYPERSLHTMKSFDTGARLREAIERRPDRVVFVEDAAFHRIHASFYQHVVPNPDHVPVVVSSRPLARPGDCLLYPAWLEDVLQPRPQSRYHHWESLEPGWLGRRLGVPSSSHVARLRCY